jgi:predicted MPP superfamily phosphohydrolase
LPWPVRMTMTISLAVLPVYIYVGWRFGAVIIKQFDLSTWIVRPVVFVLILWAYTLPIYYYLTPPANHFTESMHIGWMDYVILLPFWYGLIIIVESFPYFLLLDLISIVLKLFKKDDYNVWANRLNFLRIGALVLFLIYVPVRSQIDTNSVRLNTKNISVTGLPDALDGLQLSLIADVQVDRYTQIDKLKQMQNLLDASGSEMLFFAGDIVTSGEKYIQQAVDALCGPGPFKEKFACMGDHDFWSDENAIMNGLKECKWNFLDNQHKLIEYKGKKILVTGITHIYSRRISQNELNAILSKAPEADYKILLVHQPAEFVIHSAARAGYQLLLAGHTHGGQIVFHPFGFNLTASQRETQYYSGYYRVDRMDVIVTNGIGLTLAPIRYRSHSEVFTIRLTRAQ